MGYMTGVVVAGMLTFGTCTVVVQKLILSMDGVANDKGEIKQFKKPWFQTEAMFIGMFGCLAVYEVMRCIERAKKVKESEAKVSESKPLVNSEKGVPAKKEMAIWKQYCIVCTPALCDMCATAMMNVSLLWIAASVWQMLRGSMVIFSALFSKFFLKRELHASHWIGVCVVAFSLSVVALVALNSPPLPQESSSSSSSNESGSFTEEDFVGAENKNASTAQIALGCALVVFAQVIQASQIVVEEFLLKEIELHPVLVVGLEGFWGTISCSILLCFTSYIPEDAGGEKTLETLYMFFHNGNILGTGIFYAIVILCYNLFGMFVTQYTSAVLRTILEGLRCACIWVTNLFIFYVVLGPNPRFGEVWSDWSYLQFCGFLFLLLGMFVYNGIIRIDGLYYKESDPFRCNVVAKIASHPDLAPFATNTEFIEQMKQFQTREKVNAIRDALVNMPDMDDTKLQALEAIVGITPVMIATANQEWDKKQRELEAANRDLGDSVVEVQSTEG